jgi:hypothetical protein
VLVLQEEQKNKEENEFHEKRRTMPVLTPFKYACPPGVTVVITAG